MGRFREVLEIGSLEQRKEFLRGFVHEIRIDPDAGRGLITFYELPVMSLMMVPGAGVEPTPGKRRTGLAPKAGRAALGAGRRHGSAVPPPAPMIRTGASITTAFRSPFERVFMSSSLSLFQRARKLR